MDFSESQNLQFGIAFSLAVSFAIAAYAMSEKNLMWILLLFIPFQPISSRYGNINEFMVLVVGGVYLLRGRLTQFPLIAAVGIIMVAYTLSMTQAVPGTVPLHLLYVLAMISNFILFWLVYNFVRRAGDWKPILKILAVLNALVLGYCALQISVGLEQFTILGSEELAFNASLDAGVEVFGRRLTGPFDGTAMIAEYFTIQIMIWVYFLIHVKDKNPRILVFVLIALNCAFLIGTGNRGGIVTIVVGSLCYLLLFRKELGLRRFITLSLSGALVFTAMSVVVVKYTQYGVVFERLAETQLGPGFVPDSRAGWFVLWDQIVEKPVLGHGPRMGLEDKQEMTYPHNLYMFLFFTLGSLGLAAYAYFFWGIWRRFSRAARHKVRDKFLSGTPRLGILILIIFFVSEMRMEFIRFILNDYQHYIFMILGVFVAFSDMVYFGALNKSVSKKRGARRRPKAVIGTAVPS